MSCPVCANGLPEIVFTNDIALVGGHVLATAPVEVAVVKTLLENSGMANVRQILDRGGGDINSLKSRLAALNHSLLPHRLRILRLRQGKLPEDQIVALYHNALWRPQ